MNSASHWIGHILGGVACWFLWTAPEKFTNDGDLLAILIFYPIAFFIFSAFGYALAFNGPALLHASVFRSDVQLEFNVLGVQSGVSLCGEKILLDAGRDICRSESKSLFVQVGDMIVIDGKGAALGVFAKHFAKVE